MTLTEFLLARIAEDEAGARAATPPPWVPGVLRKGEPGRWRGIEAYSVLADRTDEFGIEDHETVGDSPSKGSVDHIARWDPARVLAECEAKRRIVEDFEEPERDDSGRYEEGYGLTTALQHLAAVYADHPDYREEWRP